MRERHIKVLVIFMVLSGLLLNYQNCGSQKNTASLDSTAKVITDAGGDRVDIIDANITGSLRFAETALVLTSTDADLKASGICSADQNGALLSWKVFDANSAVIAQGKALCEQGTFEIVVADASSLACDVQLNLKATLGSKAKAELPVSKKCQ